MSCYLTAFVQTNQLLYMNFPSLEREIFQKDLSLRCRRLLRCDFVISVSKTFESESECFLEVRIFSVFVKDRRVVSSNPGHDDFARHTVIFCILMKFVPLSRIAHVRI